MLHLNETHRKYFKRALRWFFPKKCSVCGKIIPVNKDYCFCSDSDSIKISESFCRHCGNEIKRCTCRLKNTVRLPDVAAVYYYGGRIRSDILDLKFKNEKHLAVRLGEYMAERCANVYYDIDFDVVTFVPMTESSLDRRMYNQSELLAKQVGRMLFLPVEDLLVKTRDTKCQHDLGGEERVINLVNSVKLREGVNVKGKNILVCDDIKTTGATFKQAVVALKKSGAERVCCICVALSDFHL